LQKVAVHHARPTPTPISQRHLGTTITTHARTHARGSSSHPAVECDSGLSDVPCCWLNLRV
jgi:hypothetical protein